MDSNQSSCNRSYLGMRASAEAAASRKLEVPIALAIDCGRLMSAHSEAIAQGVCSLLRETVQKSQSGKSANRKHPVQPKALEVIASVTKMSRKVRKTAAKMQQTTTKEGESRLREFAPTC